MICNFLYILILLQTFSEISGSNSTLRLVHVLFRHGDRTVDPDGIYPKDPHKNQTYYPYGLGELTNQGKRRAYNLGKLLRKRYDNFLGPVYTPDILEAWSSNVNRTKASVQLVLAGLFPPSKELIWDEGLNWQPIPFSSVPIIQDKLFLGVLCPNFKKHFNEVVKSQGMVRKFNQHAREFQYISENTGVKVENYWDTLFLYLCLQTEEESGLTLPEWTKTVYPEPMREFALRSYELNTANTELRRLTSGYLLEKIIIDSDRKIKNESRRKIFLYSGHELNLGHMLNTLEVFTPHIPPYSAFISFELHEINGVNGIKIFYHDYSSPEPKLLKLPICDEFCPLNQFKSLLEEYFPRENACA